AQAADQATCGAASCCRRQGTGGADAIARRQRTDLAGRKGWHGTHRMFRASPFREARATGPPRACSHRKRHAHASDRRTDPMRDFGEAPPPETFFERLKSGLARSTGGLTDSVAGIFTKKKLDAATIGELEEALIKADLGPALAARFAAAVGNGRYG